MDTGERGGRRRGLQLPVQCRHQPQDAVPEADPGAGTDRVRFPQPSGRGACSGAGPAPATASHGRARPQRRLLQRGLVCVPWVSSAVAHALPLSGESVLTGRSRRADRGPFCCLQPTVVRPRCGNHSTSDQRLHGHRKRRGVQVWPVWGPVVGPARGPANAHARADVVVAATTRAPGWGGRRRETGTGFRVRRKRSYAARGRKITSTWRRWGWWRTSCTSSFTTGSTLTPLCKRTLTC